MVVGHQLRIDTLQLAQGRVMGDKQGEGLHLGREQEGPCLNTLNSWDTAFDVVKIQPADGESSPSAGRGGKDLNLPARSSSLFYSRP